MRLPARLAGSLRFEPVAARSEDGPGFSLGHDGVDARFVGLDFGRAWLTLERV